MIIYQLIICKIQTLKMCMFNQVIKIMNLKINYGNKTMFVRCCQKFTMTKKNNKNYTGYIEFDGHYEECKENVQFDQIKGSLIQMIKS